MRKMVLAAVVAFLIPLTALGHSASELEQWYADWQAAPAPSSELMMALMDMVGRHPCFPQACEVQRSASVAGPPAPATNTGMGSDVEQWRPLVAVYFPADQVNLALAVMSCESGGNPWADNPTSSATGLMQILASTWGPAFGYTAAQLFDPGINLLVASYLYYDGGWGHWNASRSCWG